MTSHKILTILTVAMLASACGHNLKNRTDANSPIPSYFADRDYLDPKGIAETGAGIEHFVGRVAYKDNNGKYHFLTNPFIEGNAQPEVKTVQSLYFYSSVTDSGFTGTGNFPFIKADTSGNSSTEYEIRDVAFVVVPTSGEPKTRDALISSAIAAGAPQGKALYWVKAAALTSLRRKTASKISASADVAGSGFSINGQGYDSTSQAEWTPLVSVYVLPMNQEAEKEVIDVPSLPPDGSEPPTASLATVLAVNKTNMSPSEYEKLGLKMLRRDTKEPRNFTIDK